MIRSGSYQTVLLLAVDLFSRIVNWRDRNTSILFGDGAGAVVLQSQAQPAGLLADVLGAAGKNEHLMFIEAGGTRSPLNAEALEKGQHLFTMRGPEVFKQAVRAMSESSLQALAKADLTIEQIKLVIPHQANLRIIEAVAERLAVPMERVFVNIERYGNTSAASVPIALCEAADQGLLHEGDNLLLTSFGGGLSWASGVVRWGNNGKNRR
jgi:3-oxoacyl-[acyl-carrier-protein] synthase-3